MIRFGLLLAGVVGLSLVWWTVGEREQQPSPAPTASPTHTTPSPSVSPSPDLPQTVRELIREATTGPQIIERRTETIRDDDDDDGGPVSSPSVTPRREPTTPPPPEPSLLPRIPELPIVPDLLPQLP